MIRRENDLFQLLFHKASARLMHLFAIRVVKRKFIRILHGTCPFMHAICVKIHACFCIFVAGPLVIGIKKICHEKNKGEIDRRSISKSNRE